jgi:tRNA nucleotidyltransferase (CCA-adding enzyme)
LEVKEKKLFKIIESVFPIIQKIKELGGVSYLVGGTVRDLVLERETKDLDIEVHNLSLEQLEQALQHFGQVSLIGKQFGVLRIAHLDVDWSIPRRDSKGRKPEVTVDPAMTIEDACRRRDVTMNAMAISLNEVSEDDSKILIIDPFDGLKDLEKKELSVVDKKLFLDDPLRFFRVMQFVGRFEMAPDKELDEVCRKMQLEDDKGQKLIAQERIFEELKKLLLLSKRPSLGFRWLDELKRMDEVFPEIGTIVGVPQRADYHPEGSVFEHTMQALDAAALFDTYESDEQKLKVMLGVLCHDFGKPLVVNDELHSKGHDMAGEKPAKIFIKRLTGSKELCRGVEKLVRHHMMPIAFLKNKAKENAYKRLALKLAPEVTILQLGMVALADMRGRNPEGSEPLTMRVDMIDSFIEKARSAKIERGPEKPVLLGRHIIEFIKPGPKMGRILQKAYQIQIDEGITNLEALRERVIK